MRKIIIAILLLCLSLPVYAGYWEIKEFNKLEEQVMEDVYNDLQSKIENFWNLRSEKFSEPDLKKQIEATNAKTFSDTFIIDKKGLQEYYEMFLKEKNNMAQNRALYESIKEDFLDIYYALDKTFTENMYKAEFYNYQQTLYEKNKKIYVSNITYIYDYVGTDSTSNKKIYKLSNRSATVKDGQYIAARVIENWQQFKTGFLAQEQPTLKNILNIIDENIKNAQKVQDEIKNYSIAYEQKKLKNYYKSRYGNVKNCGDISNVIIKGTSPQTGCYYDANPLKVLQVINGGILARDYDWDSNRIFIITNNKYVDGDNYKGRLLYKGIYNYTSVMGAPVTVRKFQEITIPNDNFYFINK